MDNKPNEKRLARDYYLMSDLSQQQICDILDISRKTFHSWMKAGQWQRIKYLEKNAPVLLCEQYTNQLGYLNEDIKHRERKYPTKEESDIMRKVSMTYKTMRGNRKPVEDNIELLTDFSHELRMKDKKLVEDFIQPMDDYIQKRLNECTGLDDPWKTYLQEMSEDREYEEWHSTQPQEETQNTTPSPQERACPASSAGAGERSTPPPVFRRGPGGGQTPVFRRGPGGGQTPVFRRGPGGGQTPVLRRGAGGGQTPSPLERAGERSTPSPEPALSNVEGERACPAFSAGAGVRPLPVFPKETPTLDTPNSEFQSCHPACPAHCGKPAEGTNSNKKETVILPVPLIAGSPAEGTTSTENKCGANAVSDAVSPAAETPSKPLPTAQIKENDNTDLPTKKIENVDKSRSFELDKSQPFVANRSNENNTKNNHSATTPNSELPIPNSNQNEPVILSSVEGAKYYSTLPPSQRPSPFREGNILWVNHIDDASDDERKIGDSVRRYSDIDKYNKLTGT